MVEDSSHTDVCPVSSEAMPPASRELVEAVRGLIEAADVFASMRACWSAGLHDAGSPVSSVKEIAVNHSAVFQIGAAIERANAALANTPGWRDISTAPKDGADILVCATHWIGDDWETNIWVDRQMEPHVWPNWQSRVDLPNTPTHWMPLPQPPEVK